MHDIPLVRGLQRLGDLAGPRDRVADRQWPGLEPVGQGRPFHKLEHDRVDAVGDLGRGAGYQAERADDMQPVVDALSLLAKIVMA